MLLCSGSERDAWEARMSALYGVNATILAFEGGPAPLEDSYLAGTVRAKSAKNHRIVSRRNLFCEPAALTLVVCDVIIYSLHDVIQYKAPLPIGLFVDSLHSNRGPYILQALVCFYCVARCKPV